MGHSNNCVLRSKRFSNSLGRNTRLIFKQRKLWKNFCPGTYVTLLLIGAEIGEDNAEFTRLIDAARERLRRPWIGGALDAATVATVLGDKAHSAQNALTLSDQIGPILASGAKGNPRQIKRFLNTLMLRQLTADARGFGEDVRLPVLAKLM